MDAGAKQQREEKRDGRGAGELCMGAAALLGKIRLKTMY